MATEICLEIDDDGTMTVSTETKEQEASEQESEGNEGTPVKDIAQALELIKQMAEQASMAPPVSGENPEDEPPADENAEESAMNSAYRPGVTGR